MCCFSFLTNQICVSSNLMNLVSAWFVSDQVGNPGVLSLRGSFGYWSAGRARCLVVGARGRGFDTYLRRVFAHIYCPKSTGNTHPDMTENC